jgi:shikimate kinase
MILTLLGMSGAGKSFWAARLAAHGFTRFNCDLLLATKLRSKVGPIGDSLAELGQWMGFPDEADFRGREAVYLACEADVLREVLVQAAQCAQQQRSCVIDTGGSAIYADAALLRQLRQLGTVVYLSVPPTLHEQMVGSYLANPRPLIWNGLFHQAPGEGRENAVMRCYPELLRYRARLYEQYSDVTLDYDAYRDPALSAEGFLAAVRAALVRGRVAEAMEG